jgi:hypothetical protein
MNSQARARDYHLGSLRSPAATEVQMPKHDHAPDNSADTIVEEIIPSLEARFTDNGTPPLSSDTIRREARNAVEYFNDFPIRNFVSVLAERRARQQLERLTA